MLLLDIESGSVGSALVHFAPEKKPKIFGQWRNRSALPTTRGASSLLETIIKTSNEALIRVSEVAARIRHGTAAPQFGEISRVAVILHPPWATIEVGDVLRSHASDQLLNIFKNNISNYLGDTPVQFHPFGAVVAYGMNLQTLGAASASKNNTLVCSVTGEMCELLTVSNQGILGSATIPFGTHTLLRTLKTHGSISEHEARSALHLTHLHEPLDAAAEEFGNTFCETLKDLLVSTTKDVLVVGEKHSAVWVAKTLSSHGGVSALFPNGGSVRVLKPSSFSKSLDAGVDSDIGLVLSSLYIDSKLSR